MTSPLAMFLRRQLDASGESVPQFARRSGLNESGLYQILRGERQFVADSTLNKIADAFGLSQAEMAVGMGARSGDLAPDEVEVLALFRQVPSEQRPAAKGMLRGLVQPAQRATTARADASAKRGRAALRNLDSAQADHPETGPSDGLRKWYEHPGVLATFLNLLSPAALVPSAAS